MRCAVNNCKQTNQSSKGGWPKGIHFYRFPRDVQQLKHWLVFCNRDNGINTTTERVCSNHFKPEDFERNMKFELGFCTKNYLNLKEGVIPTVHVQTVCNGNTTNYEYVRKSKPFVETVTHQDDANISESEIMQQLHDLKTEIEALRQCNRLLEESETQYKNQIETMESQIKRLDVVNNNMKKSLGRLFTEGQIKKLKNGDKRQIWTDEDIERSMELYTTSVKVYNLLCRKNFPLPAVRTLQKRAHKLIEEQLL